MMAYRIEVNWAPAYELITSLFACLGKEAKTLDLVAKWARAARVQARLEAADTLENTGWLTLLAWLAPRELDAAGFVAWLATQQVGALYELLAPYVLTGKATLPDDLGVWRDSMAQALAAWEQRYFRTLDPAIMSGLAENATATRALLGVLPPEDVIERATCGVRYTPSPDITTVLLVPQYHYRPWNLHDRYRGLRVLLYPADVEAPQPGAVPPTLLRLTHALGDETRLRILRFLAGEQRSFTEVVRDMGLAKSTVHYHLVALRAAGLIRVHDTDDGPNSYSLRPQTISELSERLATFLQARDQTP